VVLGLYVLIPLEKSLLEQLVLGFRLFCASNCSICLGTERGEFLIVSKRSSAFHAELVSECTAEGRKVGTWWMLYIVVVVVVQYLPP
jgi:hypothetical protein